MEGNETGSKITKILYNQVTLVIAIVSVAFSVYLFITNPQRETDKNVSDITSELKTHEALQTKYEESVNTSLQSISTEVKGIRTGDLKDVSRQLSDQAEQTTQLRTAIVELKTIINERIPKK